MPDAPEQREQSPLGDKVAHVRRQRQDRRHTCHWPGCEAQVPPAMWGCRAHWFKLPKRLRDAVWNAYVPGQEQRMDPSDDYLAVAHEVQEWIEANHGRSGTEWRYFAEALAWYPPNHGLTGAQVYGVVLQVRAALADGRITPADLGIDASTDGSSSPPESSGGG